MGQLPLRYISHLFPKYQLQCLKKDGTNKLSHRTIDPVEGNTLQGLVNSLLRMVVGLNVGTIRGH